MPAEYVQRMTSLLGELRRYMDGATAEAMFAAGVRGVLNYGVGIPVIRSVARREERDHGFARYLYRQQVRELRMAAVIIARPECVTADELPFWIDGNPSEELLDELAMQLISHTSVLDDVIAQWLEQGDAKSRYAAMMALSRASGYDRRRALAGLAAAVAAHPDNMQVARAASLLAASMAADASVRDEVAAAVSSLGKSPAADFVASEFEWLTADYGN